MPPEKPVRGLCSAQPGLRASLRTFQRRQPVVLRVADADVRFPSPTLDERHVQSRTGDNAQRPEI